jgi:hypothetical protein
VSDYGWLPSKKDFRYLVYFVVPRGSVIIALYLTSRDKLFSTDTMWVIPEPYIIQQGGVTVTVYS